MVLRLASERDADDANEIYALAREFMKERGNASQWQGEYPGKRDVLEGIEHGTSYVVEDGGEIVATLHFDVDCDEACYRRIYEGEWKSDAPYAVIHRIAVKHHGRGIVDFCFEECFKRFPNIRIDTHRDNIPMQKCLERNGFQYCGIIYLEDGGERLAYQKVE